MKFDMKKMDSLTHYIPKINTLINIRVIVWKLWCSLVSQISGVTPTLGSCFSYQDINQPVRTNILYCEKQTHQVSKNYNTTSCLEELHCCGLVTVKFVIVLTNCNVINVFHDGTTSQNWSSGFCRKLVTCAWLLLIMTESGIEPCFVWRFLVNYFAHSPPSSYGFLSFQNESESSTFE